GWFFIGVSAAEGSDRGAYPLLQTNDLEAPLAHLLAPPFFADHRIGRLRPEKCARSLQAEAALAVLADPPGAGGEECVGHLAQVGIGYEDDELALPWSIQRAER